MSGEQWKAVLSAYCSLLTAYLILMPKRQSSICTSFEDEARGRGHRLVAGVDEVGRGALAGPVVAAAIILDPDRPFPEGLDDSKKLTALQRERIAQELKRTAVCYSVGVISHEEIDGTNILLATKRAMIEALKGLQPCAEYLLIDAVQLRASPLPQRAIIHGDSVSASIAAASVIAKTFRDRLMCVFDEIHPGYNFSRHAGYGTRAHKEALAERGPCPIHRRTFRGVLPEGAHETQT